MYACHVTICMYTGSVVKRTSINLDISLVQQAKKVLGTVETTETIHKALASIVRNELLHRLAVREFSDLTPEALTRMRQPRAPLS